MRLFASPEDALRFLSEPEAPPICRTFIIGGSQLYSDLVRGATVDHLLITRILSPHFNCDVYFPEFRTQEQREDDTKTAMSVGSTQPPSIHPDSALPTQEWTRLSLASMKEYLGASYPTLPTRSDTMIFNEDGTHYEYQLWKRTD